MNSPFESYMKWAGYDIARAEKELAQVQSLSSSEFRKWNDEQKWGITRYHYENNAFYHQKVGERFPSHWENLPIMIKSDFQEKLETVLSKGYDSKNTYVANTSGSSGHPFFFAKNKAAHSMDWALIKKRYAMHGLTFNSKQARFYGIPLERLSYLKELFKDKLMNRIRFPVFDLSDQRLERFVKFFEKHKFHYLYGYTNSLVLFGRFIIKRGTNLRGICPSLSCCIATSEALTREDRSILAEAFGVPVVNEYGASETGLIAFENPDGEWIISDETLYIETVNEDGQAVRAGEVGYLLITDLDNKAMPFIRYKLGDLGIIRREKAKDGKHRVLLRLCGRQNDTIVLPSGKKSPGLTFYYISRSILESSGVLREFIIRQTKLNEFVFDIVADRDLSESEISMIRRKMDSYLEPKLNVVINKVSHISRPASGKIKHFYSEIA